MFEKPIMEIWPPWPELKGTNRVEPAPLNGGLQSLLTYSVGIWHKEQSRTALSISGLVVQFRKAREQILLHFRDIPAMFCCLIASEFDLPFMLGVDIKIATYTLYIFLRWGAIIFEWASPYTTDKFCSVERSTPHPLRECLAKCVTSFRSKDLKLESTAPKKPLRNS
jgi:hypothetical protein